MTLTLRKIAEFVPGEVFGELDHPLAGVSPLDESAPNSISFVADRKHIDKLKSCRATALIAPKKLFQDHHLTPADLMGYSDSIRGIIAVDEPLQAILSVARTFQKPITPLAAGVDPRAYVHPTATVASTASIAPFAYVGADTQVGEHVVIHPHAVIREQCVIGEHSEIHPNAVLYPRTVLGKRVIVHAGAVLGGDGFGYVMKQGRHVPVAQLGRVELADDVEIGANTTIDRATLGATRVGEGTKIDNLVMIGHNTQLGKHNIIVGQVGLAGSVVTGEYVVMAGQAGIADHVNIGDRAIIGARSGLFQDVPAGESYLGTPARPERETKKGFLYIERLGEMRRQIARILHHLNLPMHESTDDQKKAS